MGLFSFGCALVGCLYDFLTFQFGWLYLVFVRLPLAHLRKKRSAIRQWVNLRLQLGPTTHPRKVCAIQRQVRQWQKEGKGRKMCTRGEDECQKMCFTRPRYKRTMFQVKMDALRDIIEINVSDGYVRVEPGVTVAQLLDALLPLGLTLPVVPELGQLSIGGLIQGCGIGSGSARHGLLQHNCLAYEIVTASGEVVVAEKEGEHQSLFFGVPWSLGTLGLLVSATLQTIPCPPFVRLVYQPCFSHKELVGRVQEEVQPRAGNDFVEAIQFDKDRAVLLNAKFVDQVPKNDQRALNRIGGCSRPYFHRTVQRVLEQGSTRTEYIPSGDYFRRHWRSLFWEIGEVLPLADFYPVRLALGWLLPPALPVVKSTRARRILAQQHVLQNLLVPVKSLGQMLSLLDQQLQIYPLWLCPVTLPAQPGLLRNRLGLKTLYVNVGVYGSPQKLLEELELEERLRMVEDECRDVQGFQMLPSDSHQTAAEFWDMFDATLYDWLRAKYDCKAAMPSVYEKMCLTNRDF